MEKPGLLAFPKGYFDDLCSGKMNLKSWIDQAKLLNIDGVEMYPLFFQNTERDAIKDIFLYAKKKDVLIPMMCTSPDFTKPSKEEREKEIQDLEFWIEIMGSLTEGKYVRTCRVLSGQKRPKVSIEDGENWVIEAIEKLIPYAEANGVYLVIENHYKDGRWIYPEFAQSLEIFEFIVNSIRSKWFMVNYDPSNALISGEDPINFLQKFKKRVLTMHASDRHLRQGYTLKDLNRYKGEGYPEALEHGIIGKGLIDYDKIFQIFSTGDPPKWISIEDGLNGYEDLLNSVDFLKNMIIKYF